MASSDPLNIPLCIMAIILTLCREMEGAETG